MPYGHELNESGDSTDIDDREHGDRGDTDDGEGGSRRGSALGGGSVAGEGQEKLKTDYEYKIATMLAALEWDLGEKRNSDKKRKGFNLDSELEGNVADVEDNMTYPLASSAHQSHGSPSVHIVGLPDICYPHDPNCTIYYLLIMRPIERQLTGGSNYADSFNPFTEAKEISGARIESWITDDIPYKVCRPVSFELVGSAHYNPTVSRRILYYYSARRSWKLSKT